jgi:tripartite-type tricarboxylate transporter receptor subunit TctC
MLRTVAVAVVSLAVWIGAAQGADKAEDFFKGKTITYIVATAPGGGYDTYARLIARYMNKYLPNSKVIIRNIPGAGHVVGTNTLYAAAPDGLTIGTFNTGLIYLQLVKDPGIRFDLSKMSWIGKAAIDTRVLVLSKNSGVKSAEQLLDASKPKNKLFAAGVGSAGYVDAKLAIEALHLNAELIPGYNGSEGILSMLRGETQGTIGSQTSYAQYVEQGNGFYALEIGGPADSKVPKADALAKDDHAKKLLAMISAQAEVARLTAGPPGVPADRLDVLRKVYLQALADPQLQAEAKKMEIIIEPSGGTAIEADILSSLRQSPENVQLLAQSFHAEQ